MGSLRVGSGPWIPLDNLHCQVEGIAAKLNGIGGPLDTLSFTVPEAVVPPGTRVTLTFRFNGSSGTETAFRVLDINLLNANGQPTLPSSAPVQPYVSVIPSIRPPSYTQAVIDSQRAQGQALWSGGNILASWGGAAIRARCADCHTWDGRDLKYFNYSSRSIVERSKFHGIDAAGSTAIAVYIESHSVERNGTPWNPPYQPIAGIDSLPVSRWAAGGGIAAVLPEDQGTLNTLFPGNVYKFDFTRTINARELPIQIPMPDWNTWLPKIHPLDYWGDSFLPVDAAFKRLRTSPGFQYQQLVADAWAAYYAWAFVYLQPMGSDTETSPNYQMARYSLARWRLVRIWDALQTHGLEESGKTMFPWPESAARTWPGTGGAAFLAAPHIAMSSSHDNGLRDGTEASWYFRSLQWYWLQMVLNDSNHRRNGSSPVDWPYLQSHVYALWNYGIPAEGMLLTTLAKAGEAGTGDPYNQANAYMGFSSGPRLGMLFASPPVGVWAGHDPLERDAAVRALVDEYAKWIYHFGRDYFINTVGELDPLNMDNTPGTAVAGPWIRSHAGTIQSAENLGYAPDILTTLREIGTYLWPGASWTPAP